MKYARLGLFAYLAVLRAAFGAGSGTYERQVRPLLEAQCAACHSERVKTSGFSIADMESVIAGGNKLGRAVAAGEPESSKLIKVLRGELSPRMPFGKEMAAADIAVVADWIRGLPKETAAKAGSGEWTWPFRKPVRSDPPALRHAGWVRNPIDAFVEAALEAKSLAPAPDASRRTLARRVYFDLVGMPPTPDEMRAFLDDTAPGAYEKLIDRLLDDPRYGERWGRHWLDLVRYGETSGLEGDGPIGNAWRYRDWVIEAFQSDMPYDRFIIQQLGGGDEHSKTRNNYQPDVQGHVALGFLRVAPWDRSNLVADEVRQNYLSEVTTATSSIFLGLTVGCARCHDHKYDPIPTRDFYRLQAFFQAVQVQDADVPYKDTEFGELAKKKIKEYTERLESGPEKKELDEFEKQALRQLIAWKTADAAGRELTVDDLRLELRRKPARVFGESEKQRHAQLREDADRTQDLEEKQALDAYEKTLLARLKETAAEGKTDNTARYKELKTEDLRTEIGREKSKIFDEAEREKHRELTSRVDVWRRRKSRLATKTLSVTNVPGPPNGPGIAPTHILRSGDYRQPGEAVEPGFPSAITGNSKPAVLETDRYRQFPTRGRRITLARWIASPENPLTARVMVNRIWQQHFGRGIIATPSDFGKNGARPTHPELLDWLAVTFMENGWSVKSMHRLMLTSATYRQSSENPAMTANSADPDNKLLWKFERKRLEAEAIRDSLFWVSGRLNLKRGGPSVFPPLPADLADFARYGRTGGEMWEPNETEADDRRRSVYTFQRRSLPLPMMLAFDAPVFSESCERRSVTTTPLQALSMLNSDLVSQEARHLAERVARDAGDDPRARISRAFEIVLSRPARPEEADRFAKADSLVSVCRVLLNSNEFLYVD